MAIIAAFVVSASAAEATTPTHVRQLDALLGATTRPDGPGAEILIMRGDTVVYDQARGLANVELGVPLEPRAMFRIASITKTFTAAAIVKLEQDGRLSLEDPLSKYVPEIPGGDKITLKTLLEHRSGIADIVHQLPAVGADGVLSTAEAVAAIAPLAPKFAPGARFAYSNSGYILLGAVIEKVTGKSWHDAVLSLTVPADLATGVVYGDARRLIPKRVNGYIDDHGVATNASAIDSSIPAAAGGLIANAPALGRWMRALCQGRIVSAQDFARMRAPGGPDTTGPYGLGLYLWKARGQDLPGHSGQIDGFTSAAACLPDSDVTIVILANNENFDARGNLLRTAAIMLDEPYVVPPAVTPTPADIEALSGTFVSPTGDVRTIFAKDGRLYSQRGARDPAPMQMSATRVLRFDPDALAYFIPQQDREGRVTALDFYRDGEGPPARYARSTTPAEPDGAAR
ncbi:hypothetical protein CA606_10715 [Caulobacter vibrioides]|uniref:Beta-lactamase-related domain-containing protein n=1 Tax=Caulobacter vibrioides TaxID=155892 RepID=A0A290ML31_CAUVI|nr:serine hydrolase domain-containing protein [Caulobacter vibrioides]ATC32776.1 hypothetical protein CA606_10715 [Caulobacter vibrioides]